MEIMLTPAINLMGSVLLSFKAYGRKDVTVTAIIPEFLVEKFFAEYDRFDLDEIKQLTYIEYMDDVEAHYPTMAKYVLGEIDNEVPLVDFEYMEILWALDMGIPPAFPSYIQGYELN